MARTGLHHEYTQYWHTVVSTVTQVATSVAMVVTDAF
jgi:hypothetical protein